MDFILKVGTDQGRDSRASILSALSRTSTSRRQGRGSPDSKTFLDLYYTANYSRSVWRRG